MTLPHLSFWKFLGAWTPAAALTASVDPVPKLGDLFMLQIGELSFPAITSLLGIVGVLLARPLARKREASQGKGVFFLVTLIMLIVVELWIIESRPSALFAFVIALGLGFSGYSLIELAGGQATTMLRRVFGLPDGAAPGFKDKS